jgi:cytochrome oxidase Cu insertion factor (SCO1/SenC/PrrC family)
MDRPGSAGIPGGGGGFTERERWALTALGMIVLIGIGWWAAALWPLPSGTPDWVIRARAACFGSTDRGLPDAGGWIMLVGTPLSLLGVLLAFAGDEVGSALSRIGRRRLGRAGLAVGGLVLIGLSGAAGLRVADAYGYGPGAAGAPDADGLPEPRRLATAAPPLALIGHRGDTVTLEQFRGRPVLVTFVYGRCSTVCPTLVRDVLAAQAQLADITPVVLVVTLDPWRDTVSRLPHIAASWDFPDDAHYLGGEIDVVEATVDGWGVERARDPRTGEIAHPTLVHVIDTDGSVAFVVAGNAARIARTVRRL